MATSLEGKRLELLHEVVPKVARIAVLVNPHFSGTEQLKDLHEAARILALELLVLEASSANEKYEGPWWEWTREHVQHALEERFDSYNEVIGCVIGTERRATREALERETGFLKREIEQGQRQVDIQIELHALAKSLRDEVTAARDRTIEAEQTSLRRELDLLRQEIAVERGLQALKTDVAQARAEIPNFNALEARFDVRQADLESEQARLERELAKTKDRLGKMRVNQSIVDYKLSEMSKQVEASSKASIEMEFESTSSRFQMKATHPQAAAALKEFAGQIIDGQRDGTLWLPGPVGKA